MASTLRKAKLIDRRRYPRQSLQKRGKANLQGQGKTSVNNVLLIRGLWYHECESYYDILKITFSMAITIRKNRTW